jgi:hypothetical protein
VWRIHRRKRPKQPKQNRGSDKNATAAVILTTITSRGVGTSSIVSKVEFESVRFEVFTAVPMKNGVFWDVNTQFLLQRRHITSPLQSSAS